MLAGKDLQAGGTWLGIDRQGRFAAVTNYWDKESTARARSRGELVSNYLRSEDPPGDYLAHCQSSATRYAGYSLLFGDTAELHFCSNRSPSRPDLAPGVYGLSNAALNTSWPKIEYCREELERLITAPRLEEQSLFEMLANRPPAADGNAQLSDEAQRQRIKLSVFVQDPDYGTRSSSVVLLSNDGQALLAERRFDAQGIQTGEDRFEFRIAPEDDN